jgi:hypothetical protein
VTSADERGAETLRPSWRTHDDTPIAVTPVPGAADEAFYVPIGDFQGAEYRRNAFAVGTTEEVATLVALLDLTRGDAGARRRVR